jgi:hypothetical protein
MDLKHALESWRRLSRMIRHAAQTLRHFALTILLLAGGICAVEVGLRIRRASQSASMTAEAADIGGATTTPSRATYLTVAPKLRFSRLEAQSGRPFTVRTNSFGLRNPEIEIPRPDGVFRVLCLGDDTTFAGDLPESFAYPRRLAELIQTKTSTVVEVLNAGCPGGCPTISALQLRHHLMMLQPDVIIVHIDPSDLVDEESLKRHVERTAEGFPMSAIHPALAGRSNVAAELGEELLLLQLVRSEVNELWSRGRSGGKSEAAIDVSPGGWTSIRQALVAIQRYAEAQSVEVLVSTAALEASGHGPPGGTDRARSWPPNELAALCDELRLPLIDATPELTDMERPRRGPSFTPEAHDVYAQVLAENLLARFAQTAEGTSERARR